MTTTKPPIDFTRVDALRRGMLLTIGEMAKLLGVSRQTYYAWLSGASPRGTRLVAAKAQIKKLLNVMTVHGWPTPEAIATRPKERYDMLVALLNAE